MIASSHFERATRLLRKRKHLYLVSRELLEGMVDEMADVARQVARLERRPVPTSVIRRALDPPTWHDEDEKRDYRRENPADITTGVTDLEKPEWMR